jgi:uncharacterized membrane protein YgcG
VYEPAERSNAVVNGVPASSYPTPPERPTGDVRIVSLGFTTVRPADGASVLVLQLRMVVANNGDDQPWTLDTRQITVSIAGEGESAPAFVNGDAGEPPVVQIPRGAQRTFDLFYPLPRDLDRADRLPAFDVKWQVQTPSRVVAERTPFERVAVESGDYGYVYPYYASGYGGAWYGPGLGPYWWSGDPHVAFAHHRAFVLSPSHGSFAVGPHHFGHFAPHGGYGHGGYRHGGYGHGGFGHGGGGHGGGGHGGGGGH